MECSSALSLGGERNGRRARSLLCVCDEAGPSWRGMGGDGALYEDLVVILTEHLDPEARG